MFRRIQSKLFATYLFLAIGGIAALSFAVDYQLGDYFIQRHVEDLAQRSRLLEYILQHEPVEDGNAERETIRTIAGKQNIHVTLIDSVGFVMFDNEIPDSVLPSTESVIKSPEIQKSLHDSLGFSQRKSRAGNEQESDRLYVARMVHVLSPVCPREIRFLRISVGVGGGQDILSTLLIRIIIAGFIIAAIIGLASVLVSRRITKPLLTIAEAAHQIQKGDLDKRIAIRTGDELETLANAINEMVATLQSDIRELKKLEQYRREFLGNVSHELRTPIFSIQGYIESLQRGAANDPVLSVKFLDRAHSNVLRLNALVNDLMEISQIESGEMRMSFRYFNIIPVVQQVADELESNAAQKGLKIIVDTSSISITDTPSDDIEVFGDKERIKQVLINLVDNAIKYTDQGAITLSVHNDENKIIISVRDTGMGIPFEQLNRIFERFYRIDKDRSREAGGTGLGLAIVKHILEKHDTTISVESEIGKGSQFTFTLEG